MSGRHTPGPWMANWDKGHIYIETPNESVICDLGKSLNGSEGINAEKQANSRLIAAAPELLSACKAQHEALDTLMARLIVKDPTFRPTTSSVWPALLEGNAAIAKASPTTTDAGVAG
jgi:hypothetical protein